MKNTLLYSPNFDIRKRKPKEIKFIIFHYTGMKKEIDAINHLTNPKSKVSSHYIIKKNGEILNLVPDLYIAWHAGISYWKNYKNLNKYSIGIEISNPGHDYKYKMFTQKQNHTLLKLSKFLIKKYKIKSDCILGHSDIAPERKKDPGEKFPWKKLAKSKLALWHKLNEANLKKKRLEKLNDTDQNKFMKNLSKLGYKKIEYYSSNLSKKITIKAFQRRFRQAIVNGIPDKECYLISKNLIKS